MRHCATRVPLRLVTNEGEELGLNDPITLIKRQHAAAFEEDGLAAAGTSLRNGLVFVALLFALGLLITLVRQGGAPGPALNDHQIDRLLHDDSDPAGVQLAMGQVEQRISQREPVSQFYPELLQLSASRSEEVRHGLAHLLGKDPSRPEAHEVLLKLLHEPSPLVRNAAALSLAEFGDRTGREQILATLQPIVIFAPYSGRILNAVEAGSKVEHGQVIAKIARRDDTVEVRAPISGTMETEFQSGDTVSAGIRLGVIQPSPEQIMSALQALQHVGAPQDIRVIEACIRQRSDLPQEVLAESKATERAIRK